MNCWSWRRTGMHGENLGSSGLTIDMECIDICIPYLPIKQLKMHLHRSFPKSQLQDGGLPELLLA